MVILAILLNSYFKEIIMHLITNSDKTSQLPGSLELFCGYLVGDEEAVTLAIISHSMSTPEDMGVHSLSLRMADSIVRRRVVGKPDNIYCIDLWGYVR